MKRTDFNLVLLRKKEGGEREKRREREREKTLAPLMINFADISGD